jgi:hemerythrin-like domain-containing protein
MQRYMKQGIKEIIDTFPSVGEVLARYDIACVPCTVGTCKLEDVLKIHSLPPEDEAVMMAEVERAIYPDRDVKVVPLQPRAEAPPAREITHSPPVRKLVEEHTWIKRLLAVVPALVEDMQESGQMDAELMRGALDFIRGYADRYHHMKEEDVLFEYTDKEEEVIRVIYEDHDRGRAFVAAAAEAIESADVATLCENLLSYRELLTEHIDKEDDVLYPYIDRGLSTHQVGEIFGRFQQAEDEVGDDVPAKYERFIIELEARFQPKEADECHTHTTTHTVTKDAPARA